MNTAISVPGIPKIITFDAAVVRVSIARGVVPSMPLASGSLRTSGSPSLNAVLNAGFPLVPAPEALTPLAPPLQVIA